MVWVVVVVWVWVMWGWVVVWVVVVWVVVVMWVWVIWGGWWCGQQGVVPGGLPLLARCRMVSICSPDSFAFFMADVARGQPDKLGTRWEMH